MVHGTPTRCEGFSRFIATLLSIRRETEINFPPVRLYRALPSPISLFISHLLELKRLLGVIVDGEAPRGGVFHFRAADDPVLKS